MKKFFNIIGLGVVAVQKIERSKSHLEKYEVFKEVVENELFEKETEKGETKFIDIDEDRESKLMKMTKEKLVKKVIELIKEKNELYRKNLGLLHHKMQK